jgi:hypothetical protein
MSLLSEKDQATYKKKQVAALAAKKNNQPSQSKTFRPQNQRNYEQTAQHTTVKVDKKHREKNTNMAIPLRKREESHPKKNAQQRKEHNNYSPKNTHTWYKKSAYKKKTWHANRKQDEKKKTAKIKENYRCKLPPAIKEKIKVFLKWSAKMQSKTETETYRTTALEKNIQKRVAALIKRGPRHARRSNKLTKKVQLVMIQKQTSLQEETKKKLKTTPTAFNLKKRNYYQKKIVNSFAFFVKNYVNWKGKSETKRWKKKQKSRLAEWLVGNTQKYGVKKTNLLEALYRNAHKVAKKTGPEEERSLAIIRKAAAYSNTNENKKTTTSNKFSKLLKILKQQLRTWLSKNSKLAKKISSTSNKEKVVEKEDNKQKFQFLLQKQKIENKRRALRRILQPLLQLKTKKNETQVAKLIWLFLSPDVSTPNLFTLRQVRPNSKNRKKNRWRKTSGGNPLNKNKIIKQLAGAKKLITCLVEKKQDAKKFEGEVAQFDIYERLRVKRRRILLGELKNKRKKKWVGRRKFRRLLRGTWKYRTKIKESIKVLSQKMVAKLKNEKRSKKQMLNAIAQKTKKFKQTTTKLFPSVGINNANFRFFSTKSAVSNKTKNKKLKIAKKSKWKRLAYRHLKRVYKTKLLRQAAQTKNKIALPILRKIEKRNQKEMSALHSYRLRRKLKTLENARQMIIFQNKKLITRKLLTARLFIETNKQPKLTTVRKAAKKSTLKEAMANTRGSVKNIFTLNEKTNKNKKFNTFIYALTRAKTLRNHFLKTTLINKEKKFVQWWNKLARQNKNKKRVWKRLLAKPYNTAVVEKKYSATTRKKTTQKRRIKTKKIKTHARKLKNSWKLHENWKLHSPKKRTSKKSKVRSGKQLFLKKLWTRSVKNLVGKTLKSTRKEKKRFLRKEVKKNINYRKRRRWFKQIVKRMLKGKKPAHLKPWERRPKNPIFWNWAQSMLKQTIINKKRKLLVIKKKSTGRVKTTQHRHLVNQKHTGWKKKLKTRQYWVKKTMLLKKMKTSNRSLIKLRIKPKAAGLIITDYKAVEKKIKNLSVNRANTSFSKTALKTPYLTLYYRLKARLQNKKNRRGVSKKDRFTRQAVNFRRLQTALKIQRVRRKINAKQKKQLKPFKSLAIVARSEKRKRHLSGIKRKKRKNIAKNRLSSYPNAAGYTRKRRIRLMANENAKRDLLHRTAQKLWKEKIKIRPIAIKKIKEFRLKIKNKTVGVKKVMRTNDRALKSSTAVFGVAKKTKITGYRLRSPGAGRIKNTFDAALRKQYTTGELMRTVQKNKKINKLSTLLRSKQLSSNSKTDIVARFRKNSSSLLKKSKLDYLPATLRSKNQNVSANYSTGKFVLAKTAKKLMKRTHSAASSRAKQKNSVSNNATAEILLRAALYKRKTTRRARDLKKLARKHKITRIKVRPFWLKRKHAKKLQKARSAKLYPIMEDTRFSRPVIDKWALNDLDVNISRKRTWTTQAKTLAGEDINPLPKIKRVTVLRYIESKLKKKKRLLEMKRSKLAMTQKIRIKKRKTHRTVRGIKTVFSRFWRQKKRYMRKLKIWKIRKRYWAEGRSQRRLAKRLRYNRKLKQLSMHTVNSVLLKTVKEKEKITSALNASISPTIVLTPLHFKKLSTQLTASREENKKWQQHIHTVQKQKYGKLEEISNALTVIMPNIISFFLKEKNAITKNQVRNEVITAYWNLRLLIQQAYRSKKFNSADINPAQLLRLKQEMNVRAANRFFGKADVKKMRYRFQTHRLIAAPSLQRGAEDWIRQYLPKFYDLFLEDAEKYGHLMITPIKIFRAHPNCTKIKEWETRTNPSTIEAQFKRLTRGTRGRSSSRFENMLITAKRSPTVNSNGQAAAALSLTGTTSIPKWNSFFKRNYGTYTKKYETVTKRVANKIKYAPTNRKSKTPTTLLKTYKKIKERNVTKAKKRHISDSKSETSGVIDIRTARQKSPRNSEFLARLENYEKNKHEKELLNRKIRATPPNVNAHTGKSNRLAKIKKFAQNTILTIVREQTFTRRKPTFVKNKKIEIEKQLPTTEQKRLEAKMIRNVDVAYIRRIKTNTVQKLPWNRQNILQSRSATSRKPVTYETPAVILPAKTFQVTRQLKKRARKFKLKTSRAGIRHKRKANFFRGVTSGRGKIKKKVLSLVNRTYPKTKMNFRGLKLQERKNIFSKSFINGAENKIIKKKLIFKIKYPKTKNIQKNFVKRFKSGRALRKKISKLAAKETARKGVSLWATRRKELWHQLTSRWMKKRRILRRWLKGIKYSFKEKTHWTFEGEHALPDELFRLSRSRLRKLEWKKADGKFEYVGLKKQLTLKPAEKRTAPWLEGLLYSRALYSTRRLAIRRYQLPKDQKSKKWLQKAKKQLFRRPITHLYIKRRHWARLRMYNQRLSRSLFHIRNTKVAVKRFQRLNRKKTNTTGFEMFTKGHFDRVDVNLILMKFAPSTFWAREMTKSGLMSINGQPVVNVNARFTPGDQISWNHGLLKIYRKYFESHLNKWEQHKQLQNSSRQFPKNMMYQPKLGALTYTRHPTAADLHIRGRTNRVFFNWFRLDSRLGR